MALDVIEAIRPDVDAYVLDLLEGHVFRVRDFHETRQGVCRLLAPLTHHLAEMAPRLRWAAAPVAEHVARMLVERPGSRALSIPTVLTQDRRSAGRLGQRRGPRRTPKTAAPAIPSACRSCSVVLGDDRTYCDGCHAERRVEQGHDDDPSQPGATAWSLAEFRDEV